MSVSLPRVEAVLGAVILIVLISPFRVDGQAVWVEQGPGPATNTIEYKQSSGAINTAAVDPSNPARIFVASVNGGIWRTTNGLDATPSWTPLTEHLPSLATAGITFSPLDATRNTLYAGFGNFSSGFDDGNTYGIIKTTNGGNTWAVLATNDFMNQRVWRIVATGVTNQNTGLEIVLVATGQGASASVFRSVDGGASFSNVLNGNLYFADIAQDPVNRNVIYAGIPYAGIFRSTDVGATWSNVNGNLSANLISQACCIRVSVCPAGSRPVYAHIPVGQDPRVFRTVDGGVSWQTLGPFVSPPSAIFRLFNISLVADPIDTNVVFAGGTFAACPQCDAVFRWNGSTWTNLEGSVTGGTGSHPDSRHMLFDSAGDILQCDDGGIFKLSNPNTSARRWSPILGDIRVAQMYTIAYDSWSHTYFGSAWDVGNIEQTCANSYLARIAVLGDGTAGVAADNVSQMPNSLHYLFSGCGSTRQPFDPFGMPLGSTVTLGLQVSGTGQGICAFDPSYGAGAPFILNAVDPTHLLTVSGNGYLYESANRGDTLTAVGGSNPQTSIGGFSAWAYGGRSGGVDLTNLIYYASGATLNIRTNSTGLPVPVAAPYPGSNVIDLGLDPDDWNQAYLIDQSNRAWRTSDGGTTTDGWTEFTGSGSGTSLSNLCSQVFKIAVVPNPSVPGRKVVVVGGRGGVFVTRNPDDGPEVVWERLGAEFPNVIVRAMVYDATDDVLVAATWGRGAWKMSDVRGKLFGACFTSIRCNPSITWLDFNYSGTETGCSDQPYNTLAEGTNAVPAGATLAIKSGTTAERPTISKPMTIEACGGTVTIGRQP